MTFAVYLPPQAEKGPVPSLYWLSGLTCTDENFSQKAGFARAAAARGVALVMPDTSPRGVTIAVRIEHCSLCSRTLADAVPSRCVWQGADDSYDFGSGAGFYVDATTPEWKEHYVRATRARLTPSRYARD